MDLSIIILSYNTKDLMVQTLDSVKIALEYLDKTLNKKVKWEVIVPDNNSTDGIDNVIEKKYKWVKLIRNKQNLGFSKGNNIGVKVAQKSSKYLIFLNNDVVVNKDVFVRIFDYMQKNTNVGLATCKVTLWTGGLDWDCHRSFPTPWRAFCYFSGLEKLLGRIFPHIFGGYHLLYEDINKDHEIDVCLGAFMIVRRSVGEKVNWWSENYFMNGEDVDLCYKIKKIERFKIMYTPITKIVHYKGAAKGTKTESQGVTKASSSTKKTQLNAGVDAMKVFYHKYYRNKYPKILTGMVYLGIWLLRKKRLLMKKE